MTPLLTSDPIPPPVDPVEALQLRIDALAADLAAAQARATADDVLAAPVAAALERFTGTTTCPLYLRAAATPWLASRKATA